MSLCAFFCGSQEASSASPSAGPPSGGTIVAVGDSLTAGFGVPESEAYPALLDKKLRSAGYNWRVVNAGINGETSSGTLSRIDWIMKLKPDIVILCIGANDGLRGVDPQLTRKNIDKIIAAFKAKGVLVVLAGMQMIKNMGVSYTSEFAAIYPGLARKHGLILVPFFLANVAGDPNLNLGDGIHPNAKGYRIVADTIFPYLLKAIDKKRANKTR